MGTAIVRLTLAAGLILVAGCGDDDTPNSSAIPVEAVPSSNVTTQVVEGDDSQPAASTLPMPQGEQLGDEAVWNIDPNAVVDPADESIMVLVTRLDCNGGVTGVVFEPSIAISENEIVVTFAVEAVEAGDCPSNDEVPVLVDLGEPVGQRDVLDGACLDDGQAATSAFCAEGAVRLSS